MPSAKGWAAIIVIVIIIVTAFTLPFLPIWGDDDDETKKDDTKADPDPDPDPDPPNKTGDDNNSSKSSNSNNSNNNSTDANAGSHEGEGDTRDIQKPESSSSEIKGTEPETVKKVCDQDDVKCSANYIQPLRVTKTVSQADQFCQTNYGTSLATVTSESLNDEAYELCTPYHGHLEGCLIGLKRPKDYVHEDGTPKWKGWAWSDGVTPYYWNNWSPNQPVDHSNFNTAAISKGLYGKQKPWFNVTGDEHPATFICNRKKVTN